MIAIGTRASGLAAGVLLLALAPEPAAATSATTSRTHTSVVQTATTAVDNAASFYVLDGFGELAPAAGSPAVTSAPPTWPGWDIARSLAVLPDGNGGYTMDGYGGLHPFGINGASPPPAVPAVQWTNYWAGWDIARQVVLMPDSTEASLAGYILDGFGGLHPFAAGGHPLPPAIPQVQWSNYWAGWDIARGVALMPDSSGTSAGGYSLDGFGGLHPFAAGGYQLPPAIPPVQWTNYWAGWDIARGVALLPGASSASIGGYILDGFGGVHAVGNAPGVSAATTWPGWDIARALVLWNRAPAGTAAGWVLDGYGGIHSFAGAPDLKPRTYWAGVDIAHSAAGAGSSSGSRRVLPPANAATAFYVLDGFGGVHPASGSPAVSTGPSSFTQDLARGLAVLGDGSGGYTIDAFGGLHPFGVGGAAPPPSVAAVQWTNYWAGWDIARSLALLPGSNAELAGGYSLDGFGGLHPFGAGRPAPPPIPTVQWTNYWAGWDIARGVALLPDSNAVSVAGYLLDGFGGLHPFAAGGHPMPPDIPQVQWTNYWAGWDIARGLGLLPDSAGTSIGGYILDGYGGLHPFAAGGHPMPPDVPRIQWTNYWAGWDIARSVVMENMVPASNPGGWTTDGYGGIHSFGSAPQLTPSAYWSGQDIAHAAAAAGSSAGSRPVPLPAYSVIGDVTYHRQEYELSCEEAAIQMALSHEHIYPTQTQELNDIGIDWRSAYFDAGGTLHWGDPYTNFVGDPNGSEVTYTGYGTYYSTVARIAVSYGGHVLSAGEGTPTQDVYDAVLRGHPVVAWVSFDWAYHPPGSWLAFDGRRVQYEGPVEHTVTVVGVDRNAGQVYVYNPWFGPQWINMSQFEAAYATYNRMAVIVD